MRLTWTSTWTHRLVVLAAMPDDQRQSDDHGQWTRQVIGWGKKYYGATSVNLLDTQKVYEGRLREIANIEKLEVAEPIQLQEARAQNLEIVYGKWLDDVKGTPEDPKAVRSRLIATQVNMHAREDVTQATPPIKASRIIVSQAATKTHAKGQHDCLIARHDIRVAFFHANGSGRVVIIPPKGLPPPGVGWRCVKAWHGTREASKCWGNEVTDTLIREGCKAVVVVVPVMFVSENHGYVTVCHADDFVSCGFAAALDEVDRVLTTHFDTKILPRIGSTACGEVTGKHLGRTIRWSPQGFEWESNSKHVEDMVELCGLKLESKGAPKAITKATGRGRRDIDDTLNATDAQTFRQAAGTGLYVSIDRPSLQFSMSVVMSGMSEPKVVHQLQVVRVARYVLQHPGEAWLFGYQADPKTLNVYTDTDWAADELTRKSVSCTVERYGSHMLDCSVAKQSLVALSSGEAEFHCIVKAVATSKQTSQILEQIGMQSEVTIASDSSAARRICTSEGATSFDQRVVDTRIVSQERVPVGVGRHVAELGGHWNEKHTRLSV